MELKRQVLIQVNNNPDVVQAGTADGSAAKKGKAGVDVEIDMREEAQKGRVRQYLCNF